MVLQDFMGIMGKVGDIYRGGREYYEKVKMQHLQYFMSLMAISQKEFLWNGVEKIIL